MRALSVEELDWVSGGLGFEEDNFSIDLKPKPKAKRRPRTRTKSPCTSYISNTENCPSGYARNVIQNTTTNTVEGEFNGEASKGIFGLSGLFRKSNSNQQTISHVTCVPVSVPGCPTYDGFDFDIGSLDFSEFEFDGFDWDLYDIEF